MTRVTLNVPDISCEHCEHAITEALAPVAGVSAVRVDIPGRQVRLDYDEGAITIERVKEILREEEYPVESVAASVGA